MQPFASLETITEMAATRWQTQAHDPRLGELMGTLVRHLHAFARETGLTETEWFEGIEFLTRVGQVSNDKRKEFILLSDVLGLSMMLLLQNDRKPPEVSQSTLLGPFYIPDSPEIAYGGRLPGVADADGVPLFFIGHIRSSNGEVLSGALIDVWQTDHTGIYEAQLVGDEVRHRAVARSRDDGGYLFRTVVPVDYPVPTDGPVGALLAMTGISEFRPSHIHFKLRAAGHEDLTTHVFDRQSPFLGTDVVFGTREELLVDFVEQPAGIAPNGEVIDRPYRVCTLDWVLAKAD